MMQVIWTCDERGCSNTAETPNTLPPDGWDEGPLGAIYCPECSEKDED